MSHPMGLVGQQPQDLLGVPTVPACRGPHAARSNSCAWLPAFLDLLYRGLSQVLALAASPLTRGCAKACPLWVRQIL